MSADGIWAVVPVKETTQAKQRLAGMMTPALRRALALIMLQDVLAALVAVPGLAGIAVVTIDLEVMRVAAAFDVRVLSDDAAGGHTMAIAGAARRFLAEGAAGMLALPGDIPLVTQADIAAVLTAHAAAPSFTIVPAWDERGSNAVLCSPPGLVPLRFGDDSFLPHLATAKALGLRPSILRREGIGLDIDTPRDLAAFLEHAPSTRTAAFLHENGFSPARTDARTARASDRRTPG